MAEILRGAENKKPFSKGDVVLVLRDVGPMEGQEEAGFVFDIESGGRIFINYGGVVSLLHDAEQIRPAPDDIKEALAMRLKQNEEEIYKVIDARTSRISGLLEELLETDTFFKWLAYSIKSFFSR